MVLEYFFDFFIREVAVTYAREVPLATLQKHVLTITEIPNREGIACLLGVVGAFLSMQDGVARS